MAVSSDGVGLRGGPSRRFRSAQCEPDLPGNREQSQAHSAGSGRVQCRNLSTDAAPTIQPDRIGLLGFSHGGITALFATLASEVPTDRGGRPFQAVVAYYPGCLRKPGWTGDTLGEPASDLLILIGKNDDWVSAAECLKYVEAQSGFPHAPTIKVYPGAVHAFDSPYRVGTDQQGHMQGRNDQAAEDSYVMTKAFFDARLKSK
jgi:dienelactone hydrolase